VVVIHDEPKTENRPKGPIEGSEGEQEFAVTSEREPGFTQEHSIFNWHSFDLVML
jgi:hypothetical protein